MTTYSAGSIFLQVIPSFRNFQREMKRQVKEMGLDRIFADEIDKGAEAAGRKQGAAAAKGYRDEFSKGVGGSGGSPLEVGGLSTEHARDAGKKAADAYGGSFESNLRNRLRSAAGQLPKVEIDADTAPADAAIARIRQRLGSLAGTKVNIDADATELLREIEAAKLAIRQLSGTGVRIDTEVDLAGAYAELEAFEKFVESRKASLIVTLDPRNEGYLAKQIKSALESAYKAVGDIEVGADTHEAIAEIAKLKQELASLSGEDIGITVSAAQVLVEVERIKARLKELSTDDVDIQVRVDALKAVAELEAVHKVVNSLDRDTVKVKVRTEGAGEAQVGLSRLFATMRGGTGDVDGNGAAFRAFNGYLFSAVTLGPALIPIIGGIAAGLAGLGPLLLGAGLGIGVFFGALARIPNAVTQINNVQKNAAKDSITQAKQIRSASNSVRDAQQGVADAAKNAARARESAAESVQAAIDRQKDAEKSLADAQRDAKKAQDDLTQARVDAVRKLRDLSDEIAGGKLAERQAVIDLFNATVADQATRQDGSATNLDREQSSVNLAQAQLRLKQIREQNAELVKQQDESKKNGVEGDTQVVAAKERVDSANQKVLDSQAAIAKAAQDTARAQRDAAYSVADANENVAKAQQRLADAQANLADATNKVGEYGSSAINNLRDAMDKLSPAGQRFAYFLADLQSTFLKPLEGAIQEGFLPSLQRTIASLLDKYGPDLINFAGVMARTLGDVFEKLGKTLEGPQWEAFFSMLATYAPIFSTQFADALTAIATGFAVLFTALAPYSKTFGDALVGVSVAFAKLITQFVGSKSFETFMDYMNQRGAEVFDTFLNLIQALLNLFIALDPYGEIVLEILDAFLGFIAGIPPEVLGPIIVGILGIVAAFQATVGVMALIGAIAATFFAPGGLVALAIFGIIAGIALLVVGIIALWKHSETFRNVVKAAWEGIQVAIGFVVDWIVTYVWPIIKQVWDWIAAGATWLWKNVLQPVFSWIGNAFLALAGFLKAAWDNVGYPVFRLIAAIVVWLAEKVFKVQIDAIKVAWNAMATAFGWVWEHILKPVFDKVGEGFNALKPIFSAVVDFIGRAWSSLQDLFRKPMKWVIDTVLNEGLIGTFNKVADFFHTPHINPVDTKFLESTPGYSNGSTMAGPGSAGRYATGGTILGYSPTPTADNIPILATAGEFMQPVHAVQRYGVGFMEAVRRGLFPTDLARAFSTSAPAPRGSRLAEGGQPAGGGGFSISDLISGPADFLKGLVSRLFGGIGMALDSPLVGLLKGFPLELAKRMADAITNGFGASIDVPVFSGANNGRVSWQGATFDPLMVARLQQAQQLAATTFRILQGSFSTSVAASGSTHAGGGAVDLVPNNGDWWGSLIGMRKALIAAWHRTPAQGFSHHIHGIALGDPLASPSAKAQMQNYLDGYNGLAGRGADDGPRGAAVGMPAGQVPYKLYDTGGAMPPGWNLILNDTGRPEQVLTADQWDKLLAHGAGGDMPTELHIHAQTTSTSGEIAGDVLWAVNTLRQRGGRR